MLGYSLIRSHRLELLSLLKYIHFFVFIASFNNFTILICNFLDGLSHSIVSRKHNRKYCWMKRYSTLTKWRRYMKNTKTDLAINSFYSRSLEDPEYFLTSIVLALFLSKKILLIQTFKTYFTFVQIFMFVAFPYLEFWGMAKIHTLTRPRKRMYMFAVTRSYHFTK